MGNAVAKHASPPNEIGTSCQARQRQMNAPTDGARRQRAQGRNLVQTGFFLGARGLGRPRFAM